MQNMDVKGARKSGLRKIGEVAALFRTTPRTLLYYEEQQIIRPAKTSGGTRMYSETDIKRFSTAYELARLGIPIKTIREIVCVRENTARGEDVTRKLGLLLDGLIGDLASQIARLQRVSCDLIETRQLVGQCNECTSRAAKISCETCPVDPVDDGEKRPETCALISADLSGHGRCPQLEAVEDDDIVEPDWSTHEVAAVDDAHATDRMKIAGQS